MTRAPLGWFGIVRLGLVQAAIGSIVVLTTSTMNRVMVVELALPAMLPGALVALHYFVQLFRPRLGYGSDRGGRRSAWIVGGMGVLALGAVGAATATALMGSALVTGIALAALSFVAIGLGVGASGTSLLVLMAQRVAPARLAAAATVTWVMMIAGFIVTTVVAGRALDPFSPERLVAVTSGVAVCALLLTIVAVAGVEGSVEAPRGAATDAQQGGFMQALRQVWAEPQSRRLAGFIFVSMLAYSAQDLILEPYAGAVFGMTPGESTRLSGVQNSGVLIGMVLVALLATSARPGSGRASLRAWTIGGCFASAAALIALGFGSLMAPAWPLKPTVFCLGFANGIFAVAAIGSMMGMVGAGREAREGVRMGLWGAAQAVAFALGGLGGTVAVDLTRAVSGSPTLSYALVFILEGVLFVVATVLAVRRSQDSSPQQAAPARYVSNEAIAR